MRITEIEDGASALIAEMTHEIAQRLNNVTLNLERKDSTTVHIGNIAVTFRQQGTGSAILEHITELADAYGVTLTLTPLAYMNGLENTLDYPSLVNWYERNGFVLNDEDDMVRQPQGIGQ